MSSRIEQIIEEIEEFVESCKYQPLSTTKIVVNKEELEELLRELRLKTPDEIKRYQKIISNKDAILADAQAKADSLIAEAQAKTKEMVSQHEVMQQVGELRKKFEELSQTPILLTSQIIRVYLSRMLATFYPDIYVLSFNEITSNVQIQAIGNITLQPQEKRA